MAFSGYCTAAHAGKTYLTAFRHIKPATADSSNGAEGTLRKVLEALAQDLKEHVDLDLSECFIDASFIVAKRGLRVGKTKRGKGTKRMAVADSNGFPLAVYAASASPHEVTLVTETLAQVLTTEQPQRVIGDKAYDFDPLDAELKEQGIEMIAPHKSNRKKALTPDGRSLRRYKRRWKIERRLAAKLSSNRDAL